MKTHIIFDEVISEEFTINDQIIAPNLIEANKIIIIKSGGLIAPKLLKAEKIIINPGAKEIQLDSLEIVNYFEILESDKKYYFNNITKINTLKIDGDVTMNKLKTVNYLSIYKFGKLIADELIRIEKKLIILDSSDMIFPKLFFCPNMEISANDNPKNQYVKCFDFFELQDVQNIEIINLNAHYNIPQIKTLKDLKLKGNSYINIINLEKIIHEVIIDEYIKLNSEYLNSLTQ